jgi:hypothetical protein
MRRRWAVVIFALCAVAAGLLGFNVYRQHELSQTIAERGRAAADIQSRIDALKIRQVALKARFDALQAESERAPNDPDVLTALGARHLALVKEDQALKDDLDRVQRDLDALKR